MDSSKLSKVLISQQGFSLVNVSFIQLILGVLSNTFVLGDRDTAAEGGYSEGSEGSVASVIMVVHRIDQVPMKGRGIVGGSKAKGRFIEFLKSDNGRANSVT